MGYLKREDPSINGVTGAEFNYVNISDPASARIYVSNTAEYVDPDPGHSVPMVSEQVFGLADCRPDQPCFVVSLSKPSSFTRAAPLRNCSLSLSPAGPSPHEWLCPECRVSH